MKDITISLTVIEALAILDPIQDKALTASRLAASSEGDVREIADLSHTMLSRVATQIVDALYPEDLRPTTCGCDWPGCMGACNAGFPISAEEVLRRGELHPSSGFPMSES